MHDKLSWNQLKVYLNLYCFFSAKFGELPRQVVTVWFDGETSAEISTVHSDDAGSINYIYSTATLFYVSVRCEII